MKFKVELDCTPDEARQFLGLPDVKPMQEAVLGQVQKQMMDAAAHFAPDTILRNWLSLMPVSPDQAQEMIRRMMTGFSNAPKG